MTWIKICGTTSERDADIAIRAGANALGFIMTQSPRQVTDTAAYSIGTLVPKGVERIGVFVNEEPETLVQTARFCKFTGLQLHGDEDAGYITKIRALLSGIKILKASTFEALASASQIKPDAWLIDSIHNRGGTGRAFNWRDAQSSVQKLKEPVIVAGGLTAANVREALEILHPWGVDVVSGVEAYPGCKHPGLVAQFVDAVRQFDARSKNEELVARKGQRT